MEPKLTSSFASESGHWYDKAGEPAYTIIGANGKERPTTLRDAKKLGLVPSVTTIINVAAKPGLEIWKQKQILLSALTLPKLDGESLDDFASRAIQDSKEQSRARAKQGTDIHGSIERHLLGKSFDPDHDVFVKAVMKEVGVWTGFNPEKSFTHPYGYGGKVDLSGDGFVVDFKTKEFSEGNDKLAWPEQAMQLAAYREGLGMPVAKCFNVFISVNNPGLVYAHEWGEDKLVTGFQKFKRLLEYWQLNTGII